tara:strand:- start:838 stop:1479 length:642 start_codon:yes stop_codon:yes gene_type:complete
MEMVLDDNAISTMAKTSRLDDSRSLSEILDPDLFKKTTVLLQRYGFSKRVVESMKPWAAFTTLSLPPEQSGAPLDLLLMFEARRLRIPVFGLETVDEQIAVFDNLSFADEVELLRDAVCHYDEIQADIETMVTHYLTQDLDALMQMALRYRSPLQDRFLEVLLWERNRRMVAKMVPHLIAGGTFIAIGALHLPGPGGVLDLLGKRGYTLEPIY